MSPKPPWVPAPPATRLVLTAVAVVIALASLATVLSFGGALQPAVPTLRQAGPVTTGGLPIAEFAMNATGVLTIGWLLMTVVFAPTERRGSPSRGSGTAGREGVDAAQAHEAPGLSAAGAPEASGEREALGASDARETAGVPDAREAAGASAGAAGEGAMPNLSAAGRHALRIASLCAVAWGMSALVVAMFSVSSLLGRPIFEVLTGNELIGFFVDLPEGRVLLGIAAVAAAVSLGASLPRTARGAAPLLLIALLGITAPTFTGHAASTSNHALAVFSLSFHVAGAAAWVGGLVALLVMARGLGERLAQVVPRFSVLALVCFVAVAASGLVNAFVRLDVGRAIADASGLLDAIVRVEGAVLGSAYGQLVVAKAAMLIGLGVLGWRHRRASIPALRTQRRGPVFVRLAAFEVVVMAATIALATGLSRTPVPLPGGPLETEAEYLLGFEMPGPPSLGAYLTQWWIDPLFGVLVLAGAVLYALGVYRLRRAGAGWPLSRILAWYGGLAIVLVATSSGLARYSMVLFSAHIVQHLMMSAVAPIPLLLGAPLTLALRTLRRGRVTGSSPREMVAALAGSRFLRVATHPALALPLFAAGMYGIYVTPLFEATLADHAFHALSMLVALGTGVFFLWPIVARTRAPHRLDWTVRLALVLAVMPVHAFFGLSFMSTQGVFAESWFAILDRSWGPPPLDDQQFGGALAWSVGVATALLAVIALFVQWLRARSDAKRPPTTDLAATEPTGMEPTGTEPTDVEPTGAGPPVSAEAVGDQKGGTGRGGAE
jgi:cytochrome c oxidase assembly factor CtaG/putative copper export protein